jgi:hypothetical protein
MRRLFLFCFIFCALLIPSQTPVASWLWAKGFPVKGVNEGMCCAVDPTGNIISAGFMTTTLSCGTVTLSNNGIQDIFVIKQDASGNVLWGQSFGGTSNDIALGVATDASGNIFLTGSFVSPAITFGTFTLTNGGGEPVYLVKISPAGNVLWAKRSSSTQNYTCRSACVAVDPKGNPSIAGFFNVATITFGTFSVTQSGSAGAFVAKYDGAGNELWASGPTASNVAAVNAIATDLSGNIYITGRFSAPATAFGNFTLTSSGTTAFITKYDPNGSVIWASAPTGSGSSDAFGITCDKNRNVLVSGRFNLAVSFGTLGITGATPDAFLAKADSNGKFTWVRTGVGGATETGYGVAADSAMNVIWLGTFAYPVKQPITFGNITLPVPVGNDPYFIVKYDPDGNILCADLISSGGDDAGGLALTQRGEAIICSDYYNTDPFVVGPDTLHLVSPNSDESIYVAKWRCETYGTGVEEHSIGNVLLFPNPVKNILQIHVDNEYLFDGSTITIKTLQGQSVLNLPFTQKIDCSVFTPGTYILEFSSRAGNSYRGKFIKE